MHPRNINNWITESSRPEESKATDHAARPSEAAFSHARHKLLGLALRLRQRSRRDTSNESKPINHMVKDTGQFNI